MRKLLKITFLAICVCLSILSVGINVNAAASSQNVPSEELQRELNELKQDIITLRQQQGTPLTQEQLSQQLISAQQTRIGVLEGNITSLLGLIGAIIAILAFAGTVFSFYIRRLFIAKVDEVEQQYRHIVILKNDVLKESDKVSDLKKELNSAVREVKEVQYNLDKSKLAFDQKSERIDDLDKLVNFVDLKCSRIEMINTFKETLKTADAQIAELNYWLEGTLPHLQLAQDKATQIFGANVTRMADDEKIEEKLSHYVKELKSFEKRFWEETEIPLKLEDFEDSEPGGMKDPLNDPLFQWNGYYTPITKMYNVIDAQIQMNPTRFIPKPRPEEEKQQ